MRLLDTCSWLWLVGDQGRLSTPARQAISASRGAIFVSAISAFEIAVKHQKGNLALPQAPELWVDAALRLHGLIEIPLDWRIAVRSTQLPRLHADPCDRILVATAILNDLEILTPDPLIRAYPGVRVRW